METGNVMTVPASNSDHPLNDTLQKAREILKSHQQWISNRAHSTSVAPKLPDDVRIPKKDLWMAEDEDLVNKRITRFPVRKLKLGGFKPAAVGGKKIFPASAIKPMQKTDEPVHEPKAAITAWDGPNPRNREAEVIAVDLEENTSIAVVENSSNFAEAFIRRKEQESTVQDNAVAVHNTTGGDSDKGDQTPPRLEELTTVEQQAEDTTAKVTTPPSKPMYEEDNSITSVETSLNGTMPLSDVQQAHSGDEDEQSVSAFDGHVLAVSPAPASQQLSLSSVTQSKLRTSELEAFRLENSTAISAGPRRVDSADNVISYSVLHNQEFGGNKKDITVRDSVLHVVTPQQKKETPGQAAVFTVPMKSVMLPPVASSVQSSGKEKAGEEGTSVTNASKSSTMEADNAMADSATTPVAKALDLPELKDPNELVRKLPAFRDKNYSTANITDNDKRLHSPPPYVLHKKFAVLPPPCPVYGVRQPVVPPVRSLSAKRHVAGVTSTARDVPVSPALVVKEPPTVLSVKPLASPMSDVEQSDMDSTSSATLATAATDSQCLAEEDEMDFYSRPEPSINDSSNYNSLQSTSQYFVSTSGNRPLQELPQLHKAASSDLLTRSDYTPNLYSVGNIHKIQHLLNRGVDVNQTDSEGKTALMHCIHPKSIHLVSADLLMKEGTNLDHQCNEGYTVLHMAAYQGAISLVELLLLNGAQVDIRDKDGRLPLHWATHPSSTKCISTILKNSLYGVDDVDKANMTCLMWACYHNRVNTAAFLLDKHADKEEKDIDGMTAMHWAVHTDDVSCLKLLLTPDTTYFKDKMGRTVMHRAAESGSSKACEVILNLRLDAVYDTDKKGRTPLHWAAVNNRVDTCDLLLSRGADASQQDIVGRSSLDYARIKGYDHVVAMLTSHETSQADFARTSRSASLSTLRSRVPSFGQLPQSPLLRSQSCPNANDDDDDGQDNISIISQESEEGDSLLVERGCYLGLFTKHGKGPVEHHFFKLDKKEKVLLHSREEDTNPKHIEKLKVLSVQPSPSLTVRGRLDYSPLDLHKYAFCIITTHTGPMDVLAYTGRAYTGWVRELTKLCRQQEARVDNRNHVMSTRNCDETDDDDSLPASSPGWTDNSFVHKQLRQTSKQVPPNSHFFSSPTPQNSSLRQSLTAQYKLNGSQVTIPEESDIIYDGSTVIRNSVLFTSTPNKSQPDLLPLSVMNNNGDDVV